jgi:hypothetical protein
MDINVDFVQKYFPINVDTYFVLSLAQENLYCHQYFYCCIYNTIDDIYDTWKYEPRHTDFKFAVKYSNQYFLLYQSLSILTEGMSKTVKHQLFAK